MADLIQAHEWDRSFEVVALVPAHEPRGYDPVYHHSRSVLVDHRDLPCFICGCRHNRETHHWGEWSMWPKLDPVRLLRFLRRIDPYGDAALLGDKPLVGPGDIRNLVVLCRKHHRGIGYGIHDLTFPLWIAQRVARPGAVITKVAA